MGLPVLGGFPKKKLVRLRYSENIALNPAAGSLTSYQFAANGMYDPNISGTGHQPMGFDQWMTVYRKYTVIGSKINVRYIPTTTTATVPGAFGVITSRDPTFPYTSTDALVESGRSGLSYRMAGTPITGASVTDLSVTKKLDVKKYFGVSAILSEIDYSGNTGQNPGQLVRYFIWLGDQTGTSVDVPEYRFQVTIDYIAVLHDPQVQNMS